MKRVAIALLFLICSIVPSVSGQACTYEITSNGEIRYRLKEFWWGVAVSDTGWGSLDQNYPWGKFFNKTQINMLKRCGATAIRIMVNKYPWEEGDTRNPIGKPYRDYIKQLVEWCKPEVKVLLDLTRDGDESMWEGKKSWEMKRGMIQNSTLRQEWINWGKEVINHCHPDAIGILNEPTGTVDFDRYYNDFVVPSINAYRNVDPNVKIFIMSTPYTNIHYFIGKGVMNMSYVYFEFHNYYNPQSPWRSAYEWELEYEIGNPDLGKTKLHGWLDGCFASIPKDRIFIGEVGVRMESGWTSPQLPHWRDFLKDMYDYVSQNNLTGITQWGFTKRKYMMLDSGTQYTAWTPYGEFWAQNRP